MADYIHDDNTGHGGSVAFRRQRERAAEMKVSWMEGAGVSSADLTDRAQQDRIAKHIAVYGSDPT